MSKSNEFTFHITLPAGAPATLDFNWDILPLQEYSVYMAYISDFASNGNGYIASLVLTTDLFDGINNTQTQYPTVTPSGIGQTYLITQGYILVGQSTLITRKFINDIPFTITSIPKINRQFHINYLSSRSQMNAPIPSNFIPSGILSIRFVPIL